jgi:hypothetical protein
VLGERKRKGLRNAIGTQICFGSCVALIPATKKTQVAGASPSAFGSALRPVCSFSAHSQEMGVRSSNRSGTHGSPPRISGRKLAARGNSRWPTPSRARRWPAQWTRACVVCSCRSCLAVRGSRCRPALSVGRRRDLAFGPLAPPSHRKGRRAKGSRMISRAKTCGVTDRKRASQGHTQSEIVTAGRGWWFLLAPAARHGAEELRVEKRHQMMEGVPVCSKPISFTGRRWMQTRLTRPDSHELREGLHRNSMRRADRRRGSDKDVRGRFASSHCG